MLCGLRRSKGILHTHLASLYKVLCLYIFARVHVGDLDLVLTLSVGSLASVEDVATATVWFMLLEIRFFIVCFCSL